MSNNVNAYIIDGINKNGKPYTALQFGVMTSQGEYKTQLIFPSSLEINLIKQALRPNSGVNGIYGDTSPNEGF